MMSMLNATGTLLPTSSSNTYDLSVNSQDVAVYRPSQATYYRRALCLTVGLVGVMALAHVLSPAVVQSSLWASTIPVARPSTQLTSIAIPTAATQSSLTSAGPSRPTKTDKPTHPIMTPASRNQLEPSTSSLAIPLEATSMVEDDAERSARDGAAVPGTGALVQIIAGLSVLMLIPAAAFVGPILYGIMRYNQFRKLNSGLMSETLQDIKIELVGADATTTQGHSTTDIAPTNTAQPAMATATSTRSSAPMVSFDLLQEQNDRTSEAVIDMFQNNASFQQLSRKEVDMIRSRDSEDAMKLSQGIRTSVAKGVVPANVEVEPITRVTVDGKTAETVANEVLSNIPAASVQSGGVYIFQGLSGTGKGTTVARLKSKMPNAVSWSNGNVFRVVTLLLVMQCEKEGVKLTPEYITTRRVQKLMKCLRFGVWNGKYDIQVNGLGLKALVSEIENTLLKEPRVSTNIPTVAQETQGEVIIFASEAVKQLCDNGRNVLLEGRAETLDFFRSPCRFELVVENPDVLGHRRAAQRVMAQGMRQLAGRKTATDEEVHQQLLLALKDIQNPRPASKKKQTAGWGSAIRMHVPKGKLPLEEALSIRLMPA